MKKCIVMLLGVVAISLFAGCDSGDDSGGGDYETWIFINDTDGAVSISRDGGPEWIGDESFTLDDKGDERSVRLEDGAGNIRYTWVSSTSNTDIERRGNEIFFKD